MRTVDVLSIVTQQQEAVTVMPHTNWVLMERHALVGPLPSMFTSCVYFLPNVDPVYINIV